MASLQSRAIMSAGKALVPEISSRSIISFIRRHARLTLAASVIVPFSGAAAATIERTNTGIVVRPREGSIREVRVEVVAPGIFHVLAVDDHRRPQLASLAVTAKADGSPFSVRSDALSATVTAGSASARVALATGLVTFSGADGRPLLAENSASITPVTIEGQQYVATHAQFNRGTDEALYGLGQHQNGQMNLNGQDVLLSQHNMDVAVPFLVSDRNYGLLWDNGSITRFGNPKPYGLFGRDLALRTPDGRSGLSARYYVDGALVLTRTEPDIRYQYQKDVDENLPAVVRSAIKANKQVRVVWDGTMASDKPGLHRMQLYASDHADLDLGGRRVLSVWRQNWNPWYHNFTAVFVPGKPIPFHLEWRPTGGMIAVTHDDPLPEPDGHSVMFSSEAGRGMSYYFVAGTSIDDVIGGYRKLTGAAPLLPKWTYGFWQSRQRYKTQDELLGVVGEYRRRGWPLDGIVQDWSYWPAYGWGSHEFDPARFPDPKTMVDAVHAQHAHIMISIWGKFYPNTENYKELDAKGFMFTQNVRNGSKDFIGYTNSHYDPYAPEARSIYYRQLHDKLVGLGFDAWWMDNTEPDVNSNERPDDFAKLITPTPLGPGALVHNAYALETTRAMIEGLRRDQPDRRQFILTRSGFAGIQRNSAAVWSGDTVARWNNLYDQISAGVSFSLSGIPNWTSDIGGYAQEARFRGPDVKPDDLAEWRELNLRWFEFGAFSPLFRSHGEEVRREIYEISPEGSPMRDAMVHYDKLRYRLMPYLYATASQTWFSAGTIMRGLVMDFPKDGTAKNLADEYMLGHALLIAPVYEYKARQRSVYFPQGTAWYDLDTGERHAGGQREIINAPATRIPVFARAGSIVPFGPEIQYVDQAPAAPITLTVYTGADGDFTMYDDDGLTNGYQRGAYSRIPIHWNDERQTLSIGMRTGRYPGMPITRMVRVRFITQGRSSISDMDGYDQEVRYVGNAVILHRRK